ncbi:MULTISPECIES: YncE family protein [unclassified Janthinobacterium]|uniref:YncE family protein n=1 Tax=unclassified Janthinobacterium TaxID=2610881 RepID=UPI001E3FFCBD|nr:MULTISPECIES: YncE family protein [unclassified Janthinobacterium]MCC7643994.1 YncE family protein [Janthinobacterium sp. EB271-G4-3-1]MCC7692087.1 YncE family protein [Janthinobacterium sp. EB271-G4-3-2]
MKKMQRRTIVTLSALAAALAGLGVASQVIGAGTPAPAAVAPAAAYSPLPGMPPLVDPKNVYGSIAGSNMSPVVKEHLRRVYVPNLRSNDVYVIDQDSLKVVDKFKVGSGPQHVVPSWDLRTLWVANNAERTDKGSLTPIDPLTGKPGKEVPVDDPYNMYYTPDGKSAIVVAEARHRLDFRDPKTMAVQYSIDTPQCGGINHADFSNDGRYAMFTCEFDGTIAKIDLVGRKVDGYLKLQMPAKRFAESGPVGGPANEICSVKKGMPQDIRISPDGKKFFIADMDADGVHIVDGATLKEIGFIQTGVGAHGLYPSRDGKKLYVANRGTHRIHGKPKGKGSVSVIDFATEKVVSNWPIPGGGSPDMGNVSADGKYLWLSGRFDDVVYRIDTNSGDVAKVKVGQEPHGLTVWPQPGRYSLGHTGNLR